MAHVFRMTIKYAHLPERGVIEITGEDRVSFLQGLVSNDVALVVPGTAVWAALLSPQGRWLADFFIFSDGNRLLLDVEAADTAFLIQRLSRYRLRAQAVLRDASAEFAVHVCWGDAWSGDGITAPDPRLPEAGWRILAPAPLPGNDHWESHRLALGLPDGMRDLERDKTLLLEAGFDELNGISWSKGCYMGQELTARTRYRGLVKRRLIPVEITGPVTDTPILRPDGREIGVLRSHTATLGLAMLRLDALGDTLTCGAATLKPVIPGWMRLPE